jgi:FERM, RhoGEF and pleckstrin domain protein 2
MRSRFPPIDILKLMYLVKLLQLYEGFVSRHRDVLEGLEMGARQWRRLSTLQRDFEAQKVCYLPLSALALKPLHRLLSYDRILERLMKHHGPHHPTYNACLDARQQVAPLVRRLPNEMRISVCLNFLKIWLNPRWRL